MMWTPLRNTLAIAAVSLAVPPLLADEPITTRLVNGGFESNIVHDGWSLHVYGAQPNVTLDAAIHHEGRQSLRIEAGSPSDTALGQEVQLKPGRRYRLRGWVRTENLDPRSGPVCGTFQVQHPGGIGSIVTGRNHQERAIGPRRSSISLRPATAGLGSPFSSWVTARG